jgi:exodeoxyribonuclease VIII
MLGMGGDMQAAHYLRGNHALGGPSDAKFVFLVQEIDPPYACSFIGMPPAFIELGNRKLDAAAELWRECLQTNDWPAYPDKICWPDVPSWAEWQMAETLEANEWEKRVEEIMETGA